MFNTSELRRKSICGLRWKELVDLVRVDKIKQFVHLSSILPRYMTQENMWRDYHEEMDLILRKLPQEK